MPYATPEELINRLDQRVVTYLTDEFDRKTIDIEVLRSTLEGASAYISAILPTRLQARTKFVKELELQKAMAMLYKRFGFFTEAATLEQQITSDIRLAIESSVESGRSEYHRNPMYYREDPIVDPEEWRKCFDDSEY